MTPAQKQLYMQYVLEQEEKEEKEKQPMQILSLQKETREITKPKISDDGMKRENETLKKTIQGLREELRKLKLEHENRLKENQ